jgi:uracil phosphoribosyltransferase
MMSDEAKRAADESTTSSEVPDGPSDSQYRGMTYEVSEIEHAYPDHVHILDDPVAVTRLADLCAPEVGQPLFNRLIRKLYNQLIETVVAAEFPRRRIERETRMQSSTSRAVFRGEVIDPSTPVVTVDVARAGMVPSQICFDVLNNMLAEHNVRQDHLFMQRETDDEGNVVGASLDGSKAGDSVEDAIVLLPDPMGATGSSMSEAIQFYKDNIDGDAHSYIPMNLIITPEYVRRLTQEHPDTPLYAMRLDRGMSDDDVLETPPGTHWERESGLDDSDYIVPGGGGFGELINNAWV